MKKWNLLVVLVLTLAMSLFVVGCPEDDDNGPTTPTPDPVEEQVIGTWLSADANVAPLLVTLFGYDSVLVVFGDNNTVTLNSHVTDGAWTGEIQGVYSITEAETGDIHTISLEYAAFSQEGIVELYEDGTMMRLEVVQTVPDIGATPLTPEDGFGADPTLQDMNIQVYEAYGQTIETPTTLELLEGDWLSAGDNVAPLLVTLFNYDSVRVNFGADNTVSLNSHVNGGAWTGEIDGVFTVTESINNTIHTIYLAYSAFEQQGIIQLSADHDTMTLEVVQVVPDIGATPLTPADGFGADVNLGDINIQTYVRE